MKPKIDMREHKDRTYDDGIRHACAILDEMFARSNPHEFMQGDCVLAKLNMLPIRKVRKNPFYTRVESGAQGEGK